MKVIHTTDKEMMTNKRLNWTDEEVMPTNNLNSCWRQDELRRERKSKALFDTAIFVLDKLSRKRLHAHGW